MAKHTLENVSDLTGLLGKELEPSDWVEITQEDVDLFAKATGDLQWIHVDPEKAEKESPYGRTIAHGYFTLSLAPRLRAEILDVKNKKMTINYGLEKVRFPAPAPVGEKVRLKAAIESADQVKGGLQTLWTLTFEIEGQEKPACVAKAIYRYLE